MPDPDSALAELRQEVRRRAGLSACIFDVRGGYLFREGWITDQPALVVIVADPSDVAHVRASLPAILGRYSVEVTAATPFDHLDAAASEQSLERLPVTTYSAAVGRPLRETNVASVLCHASPDAGWPVLHQFLGATKGTLTIGMYDFTAPHIRESVERALGTTGRLRLILQRGQAPLTGTKAHDHTDEETVERLRKSLAARFDHTWAVVSGPRRVFASSYHLKVAVRDRRAVWLSSGNWQSSNLPAIAPADQAVDSWSPLIRYNREWHVVVEGDDIAEQLEDHLIHDMNQARDEQLALEGLEVVEATWVAPLLEALPPPGDEPRYFKPLEVRRPVRVQPLLTPDNYREQILGLLNRARESILFQNQSLSILGSGKNEPGFIELLEVLRSKQRAGLDVRIIIRGDFNPRTPLERMQEFGFDMRLVRCQNRCHNKGLVVDGEVAVVGSHNWSNYGTLANRDASLIFYDREVADYFGRLFTFDWHNLARSHIAEVATPRGMAATTLERDLFSLDEIED